jgi:hypothetical protein
MNTPKLVGLSAMLALSSKFLQKLGACQLSGKNITSLSQSSVSGTDRFLSLQIEATFKQSTLVKIAPNDQLGDLFTKGLDKVSFENLQKMLMGW